MSTDSRGPKTAKAIALYVIGIALVVAGAIVILQGTGVLGSIPAYVFAAIALLAIGLGTLAGISSSR